MADESTVYLDTETTGHHPPHDEILDIAIIDASGNTLLNTLVKPLHRTSWDDQHRVHGISPSMVEHAPTLDMLRDEITELVRGKTLVSYNADADKKFLPNELAAAKIHRCCMLRFADHYQEWYEKRTAYRWKKLVVAAKHVLHEFDPKTQYRAIGYARACRAIWMYLQDPVLQAETDARRKRLEELEKVEQKKLPPKKQPKMLAAPQEPSTALVPKPEVGIVPTWTGFEHRLAERQLGEHIGRILILLLREHSWSLSADMTDGGQRLLALAPERRAVKRILAQYPGLTERMEAIKDEEYRYAKFYVSVELEILTPRLPNTCPFSLDEILTLNYWPAT